MSSPAAPGKAGFVSQRAAGSSRNDARGRGSETQAPQARAGNHAISALLSGGIPLPEDVRADMEARFGTSFAEVRVHTSPMAQAVASAMSARALTHGHDVVFGRSHFTPDTTEGRRLLAHELAHVVQQRRGGRSPTLDAGAFEANLESGADRAADAVCASSGPMHAGPAQVDGASAPGVSLSPANPSPPMETMEEPDRTDISGGPAWREWLTVFEGMEWDDRLQRHTAQVGGALYVWDDRGYQERRRNVAAYFSNRLGEIHGGADSLEQAVSGIREIHDTWYYRPLFEWLNRRNDLWFPQEAFEEEILTARAYGHQAQRALADEDKRYLAAFDFLEAARISLDTAATLLENYRDELLAASRSVAPIWGDAIDLTLGVIKGALSQITDLADTAFWTADNMRTSEGGTLQLAMGSPTMAGIAVTHDLVKAAGAVDAQGRVSTTSVLTKTVDTASTNVQQTFGSAVSDRYFFTPAEAGELAGALGFQGLLLYTGVKEVQLVFDVGGAISSLRTMVNTYRDNPDWPSDPSFWAGFIGLFLGLIGLKNWKGANKTIEWILRNSAFINAAPVVWQLSKDLFDEELDDEEREKRVKEDLKRLANILFLPLLQSSTPARRGPAPEVDSSNPSPGPGKATKEADTSATATDSTASHDAPLPMPPGDPTALDRRTASADIDEGPLPDNILPYRTSAEPRPPTNREGELVPGPWKEPASQPAYDPASVVDEAVQAPLDMDVEADLQMAVGYTPPASAPIGPALIHDAEAPVASIGRNRRNPPRPPASPGTPTPSRPAPAAGQTAPGRGNNGPARGSPQQVGEPDANPPRVVVARRGNELEVLQGASRLYSGEEPAPPTPGDGPAVRVESEAEQQARRDLRAPGPATDEVLDRQLHVQLRRPSPDPETAAAQRRQQLEEIEHRHRQKRWQQKLAVPDQPAPAVIESSTAGQTTPAQPGDPSAMQGTILPEGFMPERTIVPETSDAPRTIVPEDAPGTPEGTSTRTDEQSDPWDEFAVEQPDGRWFARTGERTKLDDPAAREPSPDDEPTVEFEDGRRYPEDAPTVEIDRRVVGPEDEPTVEIDRSVPGPGDEPTVETARHAIEADDEPTVRMQRPALDPDAEPTEVLERSTPDASEETTAAARTRSLVEYEPTLDFEDAPTEIIARPTEPVEATVEVEATDPGVASAAPPAAPTPVAHEPEATSPDGARADRQPSNVVPPDEHERARRRRKDRERQRQ